MEMVILFCVNSLEEVIQSVKDILGADDEWGVVSKFNSLKSAVEGATSAISGGGATDTQSSSVSTSSSPSMSYGSGDASGASGLIGAIGDIKSATDGSLGSGNDDANGAIGQFNQLITAVEDVTASIGNGDSGEGDESLISSISSMGKVTQETLGESGEEGVIGKFEELGGTIAEAKGHVQGISDGLDEIDGKHVEATISINVETNGSIPSEVGLAEGTAFNSGSTDFVTQYGAAHAEGTALASGNWAVQSDEKSALMGEIGYEIIVRNGRFFTVGENGAEMVTIKKGDIVFNHEQSEELLKNGHISGRGKAYADGTVGNKFASGVLRPLQPGDHMYDYIQKVDTALEKYGREQFDKILTPINAIQKDTEQMVNSINTINNISNNRMQQVVKQEFHVSLPNVTNSTSAEALLKDLQSIGTKKMQFFDSKF